MTLYSEATDLQEGQSPKEVKPPHYYRDRVLGVCLIAAAAFFGCQIWTAMCQLAGATTPLPGK